MHRCMCCIIPWDDNGLLVKSSMQASDGRCDIHGVITPDVDNMNTLKHACVYLEGQGILNTSLWSVPVAEPT